MGCVFGVVVVVVAGATVEELGWDLVVSVFDVCFVVDCISGFCVVVFPFVVSAILWVVVFRSDVVGCGLFEAVVVAGVSVVGVVLVGL